MLALPMRMFREGAPVHDPLHSVALMRGADEGSAIFLSNGLGLFFCAFFHSPIRMNGVFLHVYLWQKTDEYPSPNRI